MSIISQSLFTFFPSTKSIQFIVPGFEVSKLKSIINITKDIVIYSPGTRRGKAYTAYDAASQTLVLEYNTTLMSDSDELAINYDFEANYSKAEANSFSPTVGNSVDLSKVMLVQAGSGMTIAQTDGTLVIGMGTTAGAETIIRSNKPYKKQWLANFLYKRSQAIANNRISLGLVDLIGDNLAITVSSSTSATVTIPKTNPYYQRFVSILAISSTGMVGMKMTILALQTVSGAIPNRYTIASAAYDEDHVYLTFTVSAWTSGSSGTCTLMGWNFVNFYLDGTTTTSGYFDCARYGRNSSLGYVACTTPTQTGNSVATLYKRDVVCGYSYNSLGSNSGKTQGSTREECIPDEDEDLYVLMVFRNGTTAPATGTTVTMNGFLIRESNPLTVSIDDVNIPQNATGWPTSVPVTIASSVSLSAAITAMSISATSGGVSSRHKLISAASTNAALVKNAAGVLNGGIVVNTGTNVAYLKFYNKASVPAVGTDIPVYTIPILPSGYVDINALTGTVGDRFTTGIAYAITGGYADNDTTAVSAGQVFVNLNYA